MSRYEVKARNRNGTQVGWANGDNLVDTMAEAEEIAEANGYIPMSITVLDNTLELVTTVEINQPGY